MNYSFSQWPLLPNWTRVCLPSSKANLLTPGCDGGKYSIYCRHQARRKGSSCSEDPNSRMVFRERFLGNICGEGCSVHDFLLIGWWWGNRVVFQEPRAKPEVNVLGLGGASGLTEELKVFCWVCSLREAEAYPTLRYCLLTASPLFLLGVGENLQTFGDQDCQKWSVLCE